MSFILLACSPLTPSGTQFLKGNIREINNIFNMSPVGNKGSNKTEVIPPVSSDAPCALSMTSLGETSCLSETNSVIDAFYNT